MARLSLSKTQLAKENTNLAMYRRYLPSLDLKRRQLTAERNKTQARIAEIETQIERRVGKIGERNVVGLRLPSLVEIEVDVARYGYLLRPHWVDLVAERLEEVLRLRVEAQVTQRQVALLD